MIYIGNLGRSAIGCGWHRTFDERTPAWLLTLDVMNMHGFNASYPQARAVVDDFGTLVIVGGWR